ncbi:MAG: thiamine diphosphokinase [Caldisericaceae bacterium]
MKKIIIVGNGAKNSYDFLTKLCDGSELIIGVDGGAETLINYKIPFQVAIGDFDSISNRDLIRNIRSIEYPRQKDYSDTELALKYAVELKPNEIVLTDMLGGRTDHLLFNISLLAKCLRLGVSCSISEQSEDIYFTNGHFKMQVPRNATISIVPITQKSRVVFTRGFKYNIAHKTLVYGNTLTLSNISVSNTIEVSLARGIVGIFINKL